MFYYLEGTVSIKEANLAVIDCGGAGYACSVTAQSQCRLQVGQRARLYTYCNIKEDAFDIFGFYDLAEKRAFTMLLSVSGVGPKAALSILGVVSPESLALAVINDDFAIITQAPGVGKKLAQRITLELKDKVASNAADAACAAFSPPAASSAGGNSEQAALALAALGYSNGEISQAMRSIDSAKMTTEQIIRAVLDATAKKLK